jgi:hypothetical protein
LCCHPGKNLDRTWTSHGVFLDRVYRHSPLGESQGASFVTEGGVGQREIANEDKICRLFFEKRFQFVARLLETFLESSALGWSGASSAAILRSLVLFPPDDTASNLDPGNRNAQNFPQLGHGSIKLSLLFNDPADPE